MVLSGEKTLTDNKNRRMFEITLKKKCQSQSDCGQREFMEKYIVLTFVLYFM